jgi:hypothetical protein
MHEEVRDKETAKRRGVVRDFEEHVASAYRQMNEDLESAKIIETLDGAEIVHENEIVRDNQLLSQKYLSLLAEIAEKS